MVEAAPTVLHEMKAGMVMAQDFIDFFDSIHM